MNVHNARRLVPNNAPAVAAHHSAAPEGSPARLLGPARMTFVIFANSGDPEEGSMRAVKATRKDAVELATGLMAQGMQDVTITDAKGRVFKPLEFGRFLIADE